MHNLSKFGMATVLQNSTYQSQKSFPQSKNRINAVMRRSI